VRRYLRRLDSSGSRGGDATEIKMSVILGLVEILSEFVNTLNVHDVSENIDGFFLVDFIASQVVVTDEGLTRLLDFTVFGELSSSQEASEVVVSIVLVVNFSDFQSVVSQEILDREGTTFTVAPETEYFAVIV